MSSAAPVATIHLKARYCYERALEARELALKTDDPLARNEFFACEVRWRMLAQGYEFRERLGRFLQTAAQSTGRMTICMISMPYSTQVRHILRGRILIKTREPDLVW